MVTVAESLGREPIVGSPLNFSLSFILLKARIIPTMLTFGNVKEQKSTNFSNLIIKYFLFQSISTCSCLRKKEFQTLPVTDIYRETLKRYHDRGFLLRPEGSSAPNIPTFRTTRRRSVRAARSPSLSSISARNAPTQWEQTLRRHQLKRYRTSVLK